MLHERMLQAGRDRRQAEHDLYAAVLEASERENATREFLARELGVGTQTVQDWVNRARQDRDG
jgi:transposase